MAQTTDLLINVATEFTGKKAFKEAQSATEKLSKSVKTLGKAFGLAFTGQALVRYSRQAVKAFAEDQAAATRLNQVLDNLNLSFANPSINRMIDSLTLASGVTDTDLRTAFQALVSTTGSVTESQSLLNQAINISRGSGIDLATVAQDLSNAYVGNTKGLKKYNLGLTQAELKAASFTKIQKKFNDQFKGSNAAYLKTYAGQIGILSNAAGEAQEIIGKGLIDSLLILTGNTSVENLSKDLIDAAENAAELNRNIAKTIKTLSAPFVATGSILEFFIKKTDPLADLIFAGDPSGFMKKPQARARRFFTGGSNAANTVAANKAELAALARQRELAKLQKAQTKALKDQAILKKAGSIFDMDQIQIVAALKGKISEDDRKRLELQLAIQTGNVEEAQKLTYQLAKSQGLTESLAKTLASLPSAKNPFESWSSYLDAIEAQAKRIASMSGGGAAAGAAIAAATGQYVEMGGMTFGQDPFVAQKQAFEAAMRDANFTVNVSVAGEDVNSIVTRGLQNGSLSGVQPTVTRLYGGF